MLNTLIHNMSIHKGSQWLVHVRTHPHAIIHGNEAGCVPFPLIPLLQEQQKILRGRFGCHHLYPMH